jgi:hypothetical protein
MGWGLAGCFEDTQDAAEEDEGHDEGHDHEQTLGSGRLLVADAAGGQLRLIDLSNGQVLHTFTVVGEDISLYTTESGRIGAVVQADVHRVNFIDSGLEVEPHGDHTHDREHEPRLLAFSLDGVALGARNPVHFVSHHGHVTLHFDGVFDQGNPANNVQANNYIFAEAELLAPPPDMLVLTSTSQHGVSVPTEEGRIIFTDPDPDREFESLPSGFVVLDASGTTLQTFNDKTNPTASCLGMHGEAVVGRQHIFGCHQNDTGVFILTEDAATGTFLARKLLYPDARRTSVIVAHPEQPFAVGQYGTFPNYNALIRIDPAASALSLGDVVALPANQCGFDFEREHGEQLVVLVEDGSVHVFDPSTWMSLGSLSVSEPFQCFAEDPAPRLAVSEGFAYVSLPALGQVAEIHIDTVEVTRTLTVGGTPSSLAVFGWWDVLSD